MLYYNILKILFGFSPEVIQRLYIFQGIAYIHWMLTWLIYVENMSTYVNVWMWCTLMHFNYLLFYLNVLQHMLVILPTFSVPRPRPRLKNVGQMKRCNTLKCFKGMLNTLRIYSNECWRILSFLMAFQRMSIPSTPPSQAPPAPSQPPVRSRFCPSSPNLSISFHGCLRMQCYASWKNWQYGLPSLSDYHSKNGFGILC